MIGYMNRLGYVGLEWDRFGYIGIGWDKIGCSECLGYVGLGWDMLRDMLEKVGIGYVAGIGI